MTQLRKKMLEELRRRNYSLEPQQPTGPFELRPILIRTDMSNLNCYFRLLNAADNP